MSEHKYTYRHGIPSEQDAPTEEFEDLTHAVECQNCFHCLLGSEPLRCAEGFSTLEAGRQGCADFVRYDEVYPERTALSVLYDVPVEQHDAAGTVLR